MNRYAITGTYVLLGFFTLVTATCKAVELVNEAWRVTPKQKLRVGR